MKTKELLKEADVLFNELKGEEVKLSKNIKKIDKEIKKISKQKKFVTITDKDINNLLETTYLELKGTNIILQFKIDMN